MTALREIVDATIVSRARELAANIQAVNALSRALAHIKPRPRTPWERITDRIHDYRWRIVTAWRVLRGDDLHGDCD